ncbi:hypothetical protein ACLOJK_007702 [Asimina triloba]
MHLVADVLIVAARNGFCLANLIWVRRLLDLDGGDTGMDGFDAGSAEVGARLVMNGCRRSLAMAHADWSWLGKKMGSSRRRWSDFKGGAWRCRPLLVVAGVGIADGAFVRCPLPRMVTGCCLFVARWCNGMGAIWVRGWPLRICA